MNFAKLFLFVGFFLMGVIEAVQHLNKSANKSIHNAKLLIFHLFVFYLI